MEKEFANRGYLLENFRLFHLKDTAGMRPEPHYHAFCKLLMLRSGSGGYTVDGQRYALEAGDIVRIGDRRVHCPEFAEGTLYERVIVYIDPAFLRAHSTADCDLEALFNDSAGAVLRPDDRDRAKLFGLAEELEGELAGEDYGREIGSRSVLLRLLVELGRSIRHGGSRQPKPMVPSDPRVRSLLEYIDGHLTELPDMDGLAESVYLSKYHLMRLFRKETGESLHGYISRRRLQAARELIGSGVNVTEACFQVGYGSYSSFFRAYVKQFGVSPTEKQSAVRESSYE
jgi:AraC-like DNA-binding protein